MKSVVRGPVSSYSPSGVVRTPYEFLADLGLSSHAGILFHAVVGKIGTKRLQ